ncbi:pyridoxamine 5'-phosphate oxidase family protein [Legionella sp. CNM-1927-20]|uniref:pyridoxamine 5'-phosphate oxidase family protein n=1 Tax=Legionella sp. CNM-1927-20 TaxID=3422221 RepID=UPI00403AF144
MLVQNIRYLLQSWFDFPNSKLFCQVATVDNGYPHVRTMDLYDFTDKGSLIFLTKTGSRKWNDLEKNSNVAVCLLNLEVGQIIVEGSVLLQTSANNLAMATLYWRNYLPKYWQNFYLSHSSQDNLSKEIPSSFGIIKIIPHAWEILEINTEDFLKGSRKRFTLKENTWIMTELPIE